MARNGAGTYSLPAEATAVTGAIISSTSHNTTMADLADALTASLTADGQKVWSDDQDANGNAIILDVDGDSKIECTTDDQLDITLGSTLIGSLGTDGWKTAQNFDPAALSSSSNATAWNAKTAQVASLTLTENTTIGAPSNLKPGAFIAVNITQAAGSSYTVAWNSVFKGTIPTMPTGNNHQMLFAFFSPDGTNCHYCGGTEEVED